MYNSLVKLIIVELGRGCIMSRMSNLGEVPYPIARRCGLIGLHACSKAIPRYLKTASEVLDDCDEMR